MPPVSRLAWSLARHSASVKRTILCIWDGLLSKLRAVTISLPSPQTLSSTGSRLARYGGHCCNFLRGALLRLWDGLLGKLQTAATFLTLPSPLFPAFSRLARFGGSRCGILVRALFRQWQSLLESLARLWGAYTEHIAAQQVRMAERHRINLINEAAFVRRILADEEAYDKKYYSCEYPPSPTPLLVPQLLCFLDLMVIVNCRSTSQVFSSP